VQSDLVNLLSVGKNEPAAGNAGNDRPRPWRDAKERAKFRGVLLGLVINSA
jgi:hypothetical protein